VKQGISCLKLFCGEHLEVSIYFSLKMRSKKMFIHAIEARVSRATIRGPAFGDWILLRHNTPRRSGTKKALNTANFVNAF